MKNDKVKRILYIMYTDPAFYPPVLNGSQILAEKGCVVKIIGSGVFGMPALSIKNIEGRTIKKVKGVPAPGLLQKIHYFYYSLVVFIKILFFRPHWIYASDTMAAPIALILSYFPGLRILYHEHDSKTGPQKTVFMRICSKALKKLAQRAAVCVFPNEKRLKNFVEKTGRKKPSICVWNCPLKKEAQVNKEYVSHERIMLYYHGSIGPDRFPESIIEALAKSALKAEVKVVGYETAGNKEYIEYLRNKAKEFGVSERVEFLGARSYENELMNICRSCDIGLGFILKYSQDENMINMLGASNKVFEYMACGLPVIVSDIPEWIEMFVKPGYAVACDPKDVESIEKAIKWFVEHPKETKEIGERGRQKVLSDWNYEKQFNKVAEIILN